MEIRLNVVPFGVFAIPRRGMGKQRCLTCGRVMRRSAIWAEAWCDESLAGYVCRDCPGLNEQIWKEAMRSDARKQHARAALLDRLLGEKEFAGTEAVGVSAIVPDRLKLAHERTLYSALAADAILGTVRIAD